MSTNAQLAAVFEEMARLLDVLEANRFKVIAYQRGARAMTELTRDIASFEAQALTSIPGVGQGLAEKITEYLEHGKIAEHEELLAQIPAGLLELFQLPGVGPKTVALLWKKGGVDSVASLRAKLDRGELTDLPGFGAKKLDNLRKSVEFVQQSTGRMLLGAALPVAEHLVAALKKLPGAGVERAAYAGSLRRGKETIGDVDLLVASAVSEHGRISDAFVRLAGGSALLAKGKTKTSLRLESGLQIDLRLVPPESFGAALMYFTGSKEHNVALRERAARRGLKLNEYGLYEGEKLVAGDTEEHVFAALGLPWIAPELREDRGELSLAQDGALPGLLELKDIRAELHAHTTASDGVWSIEELARAAAARGFHTVAITDHSKSQTIANGLSEARLEKHIQAVRAVAAKLRDTIAVLAGSEVDILADGSLDYPDSLLKELDLVVASPHAALTQTPEAATKRLLRAIENPWVTILGHATGRLVLRREGLSPDMNALFRAAAQRGVAMEINANHHRLDLRDTHARAALEAGCTLAINTDAHGATDLEELRYGVITARRAGATKDRVINCLSREALTKHLARRR